MNEVAEPYHPAPRCCATFEEKARSASSAAVPAKPVFHPPIQAANVCAPMKLACEAIFKAP